MKHLRLVFQLTLSGLALMIMVGITACGNDDDDAGWYGDGDTDGDTDGDADGDPPTDPEQGTEEGVPGELIENPWVDTLEEAVSTFSIDVDTAAYSFIRNSLMVDNQMPPENKIRIEEMINYFDYTYSDPTDEHPFSAELELAQSPWRDDADLVMISLKGREIDPESVPASNLVFLIDVSGSMAASNKLPMLKEAFKLMLERLSAKDRISIVTYAGSAGVLLEGVAGDETEQIESALDSLQSGGSTNGADGILTAYELAEENFKEEGNNRVILATDGDFNVGASSPEALEQLITEEKEKGIFLTVLGFGMGTNGDSTMEALADAGDGNFFYIDTMSEAEKVFVHDLMANMFTIAKDVKLQVEFNPASIEKYRLIGYENRVLENDDFDDDSVDAGEIGAGHRVTAFYEVIRRVGDYTPPEPDPHEDPVAFEETDFLQLRMRYKNPDEDVSHLFDKMASEDNMLEQMTQNMGFASAVVEFGMLLRDSQFKENSSYETSRSRAAANLGEDVHGYRAEFLSLVDKAAELDL